MTLEEINKILFKGKTSLVSVENMISKGLLPSIADIPSENHKTVRGMIAEWKETFIGRFISKNPRYHGMITRIEDAIGKKPEWSDFTKQNIDLICEMFSECAPSSARTYMAMFCSVLNDAKDEVKLPYQRFAEKMSVKSTPSVNVYLNMKDLSKLESYRPKNEREQIVLAQFLIGCYTGARHSDILNMTVDNITDGYLTYVSKKTKIQTTVEAKPILTTLLPIAGQKTYSDVVFNETIRDICRIVGINENMKLFRRGKDEVGEKWQFVASHTARRSFATNLAELNVPILQIAKRMGHTDVKTTYRYICGTISRLDDKACKFFS